MWLCEEDGDLAGAVGLRGEGTELLIARLVVDPRAFRRGIGTALVQRALHVAAGRPVRVGTGVRNAPALALYEGMGFRRVAEREPAPGVAYVELRRP